MTRKQRRRNKRDQTPGISALVEAMGHLKAGRLERAEKLVRQALGYIPEHPDGLHMLGLIAYHRGDYTDAAGHIARAIACSGGISAHHANLGLALRALGRNGEALESYQKAVDIDPANATALNDMGNLLADLGRPEDAIRAYLAAIEADPALAQAHHNLGVALKGLGRPREAAGSHRKALEIQPRYADALDGLGAVLSELGQMEEAGDAFEGALEAEPEHTGALANLASLLEETNRLEEAAAMAERCLAIEADHPFANLVAAKCERRQDRKHDAIGRLERIMDADLPDGLERDICFELVRLHDQEGAPDPAFAYCQRGNRLARVLSLRDGADGGRFLGVVEKMAATFTKPWLESWTQAPPQKDPAPVFLIGFPRSGTTLLDQILDSHPGLATVEERPALEGLIEGLDARPGGFPDSLAGLGPEDLDGLRRAYFNDMDSVSPRRPGQLLVDKFPLHTVHIGLIERLFPGAKIILALRHPCDVCLSCFMQNFENNDAMANFHSLEAAATLYAKVMGLWRQYTDVLEPDFHAVRYEDLVDDFEGQVKGVLGFLGLEWDDSVLGYADHAKGRGHINTPSYAQVTQPIYGRARYRWRRYADHLAPALDTLAPFIEQFGYGQDC
jgi:tetratricopeptide (TPR) repeat protein